MVELGPKHAETLSENGIVIVEDYMEESTCDDLYGDISSSIDTGEIDAVEGGNYSYGELVNWGGPVANRRTGNDEGMTDVFNVDEIVPEVESFKDDETICDIINSASPDQYTPDNVNVYWNRSVTQTRDFHADTYSGKYKSFLYLTNVPDRSYGPFSYIRGSHRESWLKQKISRYINKFRDKPTTDAVFYDDDDSVYCTAPKGTLIIANQTGYHRGHPQDEGRERMLLTTSYSPAE